MGSAEPFTRSNSTGWFRRCWMSRIRAATSKRGSTSFRMRISSPRPSSRFRKSRRPSIMFLALLPRHRSVGRDADAAHAYHRRGGAASRSAFPHPFHEGVREPARFHIPLPHRGRGQGEGAAVERRWTIPETTPPSPTLSLSEGEGFIGFLAPQRRELGEESVVA